MNPILQQAEEAYRAKSKAKGIDRVVEAGEGIMFSEGGANLFKEQVDKEGDVVDNAAEGVAKLIGILFDQSKKTMPLDTAVGGATILMLRGLDFLEEAGRIEVTNEVVDQAMMAMTSYVMQLFGVSQDMIKQMAAKAGAGTPDAPAEEPAAAPAKPAGLLGGAMQGGA